MLDIESHITETLKLIDFKLNMFDGVVTKAAIRFDPEEIKEKLNIDDEYFYNIICKLKKDKFIDTIQMNDYEDSCTLDNGEEICYMNYPELFPGRFVVTLGSNFLKLYKLRCQKLGLEDAEEIDKRNKFPFPLPAGTQWKHIDIEFIDDENVLISVAGKQIKQSFRDMNLVDNRGGKPNKQWIFFKILSILNGEITTADPEAEASYKKAKEFLSGVLQHYFSLDPDPFYPYYTKRFDKKWKSYKVILTLFAGEELAKKYNNKKKNPDELTLQEELEQMKY